MRTNAVAEPKRKRGRWIAFACIAAALIVVGIPAGHQLGVRGANDDYARGLEGALLDIPLPPGAELLDSMWIAGKYSGNGNGMQYAAGILIRSDQTEAELNTYYDEYSDAGDTYVERDPACFEPEGPFADTPDTCEESIRIGVMAADAIPVDRLDPALGFMGSEGEPGTFVVSTVGSGPTGYWGYYKNDDLRAH